MHLARINPGAARIDPESYVYFVAAMTYMFGSADDISITTNVNFVASPFHAQACTGATPCS